MNTECRLMRADSIGRAGSIALSLAVALLLLGGCSEDGRTQPEAQAQVPSAGVAHTPQPTPSTDERPGADHRTLVNVAGRQRMLTQRIVKAHLQGLLDVETSVSRQQLEAAIGLFEAQLQQLKRQSVSPGMEEAVAKVEALWPDFKGAALSAPSREDALAVNAQGEALLAACETVVARLVDASTVAIAELVNVAGRQRMLSQRFAKLYMLIAAELDSPSIRDELTRTRNEFDGALEWLRESPRNSAQTRGILDDMAAHWLWLDGALQIRGDKHYPWIVADVSEKALTEAEELTNLYAAMAKGTR